MAGIKAGDNGTVLELPIRDNGVIVPLNGVSSVEVVIKQGNRRFVKTAQVVDAANAIYEVTLTSEDVADAGTYTAQGIVKYQDGKDFAGDVFRFPVGSRI
jgi:hypothetical protein